MKRIERTRKIIADEKQINSLLEKVAHDPELSHDDHQKIIRELRGDVAPVTLARLKKIIRDHLVQKGTC